MMRDRITGEPREVDVVVRTKVGEHEVVVSIECVEHSRKADVSWIEQMITKHQALPTHKLVLVSSSGFTASALAKATALGIEALSLGAAEVVDWTVIVGKDDTLPVTWLENHLDRVTVLLRVGDQSVELPFGPNTELLSKDGERSKTLGEVVYPVLQSWEGFGSKASELLPEDGATRCGVEFRSRTPQFIKGADGSPLAVQAVRAYITCEAITMPLSLRPATWRGTPVAYGSGASPLGKVDMTVIEPKVGFIDGAITAISPNTGLPETVRLEQQPESSKFQFIAQGGPFGFTKKKPATQPASPRIKKGGESAT